MELRNFVIPINKDSLLEPDKEQYFVQDLTPPLILNDEIKKSKLLIRNEDPFVIRKTFDLYFSVIYQIEKVEISQLFAILPDVTKLVRSITRHIEKNLSSTNNETREEDLNILKMIMYIFTELVSMIEGRIIIKEHAKLKVPKKGKKNQLKDRDIENIEEDFDRREILCLTHSLVQLPLEQLWQPAVCEEAFIGMIVKMLLSLLSNPKIKTENKLHNLIFEVFGNLIKSHGYTMSLTIQLTQLIKDNEHLDYIISNGTKILVEEFHCKSLVKEMVRELIDGIMNDEYPDGPAIKNCCQVLSNLTSVLPNLILDEITNILTCLSNNLYTVRNCVLEIVTEILLKVLSEENMSEEQIKIRNDLLYRLQLHIRDLSSYVRSKTLQQWSKLHSESAIPKSFQLTILKLTCERLQDKGCIVRKSALDLLCTFLKYNPYSANLNIDNFKKDLEDVNKQLDSYRIPMSTISESIKNVAAEWNKIKDEVKNAIVKGLESDDDLNFDEESPLEITEKQLLDCLETRKYKEAFDLCRYLVFKESNEEIINLEKEELAEFLLSFMGSVYMKVNQQTKNFIGKSIHQLSELTPEVKKCTLNKEYLTDVIAFLEIIDNAFPQLLLLLKSSTITDVVQVSNFFTVAYQFNIKNASEAVAAMLPLMGAIEQERKNIVIDAYKMIFLKFDGNPKDKPATFTQQLFSLLKSIKASDELFLDGIITEWAVKGDIDNSVIQHLWHLFVGQIPAEAEDRTAALNILTMIAAGKKTIIERNLNLVSDIIYSEKSIDDPRYIIFGSKMISLMETEIKVTEDNPCFRIRSDDPMWDNLITCVGKIFLKKDFLAIKVMESITEVIYKVCQKPEIITTKLLKHVVKIIKDPESQIIIDGQIDTLHLAIFCHLLGTIALRLFIYLDGPVYKELKRRNYIKESKEKQDEQPSKKKDDSYIEGAVGNDIDAEFILNVCERELVTANMLGSYVIMLKKILMHPNKNDDEALLSSATTALMRFMMVSSQFCQANLSLIMTILEKTKYEVIKNNIIINMADLLHRFPNVVEPWSFNMIKVLKDKNELVRMTALSIISKLILEDMLRVKGAIADLAVCLCDENEQIVRLTEDFFTLLSQKGNAIYNALPDIISHLSNDNEQIDKEMFRKIFTYLINLISKDKHVESVVDKICSKFHLSDVARVWEDLAFCLTILNHNEKTIKLLKDNYFCYKMCLENSEVFQHFLSIAYKYKTTTKEELKNQVKNFEHLIRNGKSLEEDEREDDIDDELQRVLSQTGKVQEKPKIPKTNREKNKRIRKS